MATQPIEIRVEDSSLVFRLERKSLELGEVTVEHWWIPINSLFSKSRTVSVNRKSILDCYWKLVELQNSTRNYEVVQNYILARLQPMTRDIGSRKIHADAKTLGKRENRIAVQTLNTLLEHDNSTQTYVGFRDSTAKVLGPEPLTNEQTERYTKIESELFGDSRLLMGNIENAVENVSTKWKHFEKTVGRRRGNDNDRHVLNVLSYEARAAFFRCYSEVWRSFLIPKLRETFHIDRATSEFTEFWHCEHNCAGQSERVRFHLFHGHIFALHPAGSVFIQTPIGKKLVGEYLQSIEVGNVNIPRQKVLRGIELAVFQYGQNREEANERRRESSKHISIDADLLSFGKPGYIRAIEKKSNKRKNRLDDGT